MARKTICSSDKKGSRKKYGVSNNVNSSAKKKRAFDGVIVNEERGSKSKSKRLKVRIREGGDASALFSKDWQPLMNVGDYFIAKIGSSLNYDVIVQIKKILNENQLGMFRATCFGYFLDLPKFELQCQLVHSLLLRELKQPNIFEFWVDVSGKKLKFSIEEFALVTGLNCTGEARNLNFCSDNNRLMEKYFSGLKKINKQSVQECFFAKRWDNDEDCVKIAVLYFVELFLFSSPLEKLVSRKSFDIVESGFYNEYPWGKDVFDATMESLKGKMSTKGKKPHDGFYYRLNGFPYAFQVWFYECCPYTAGNICVSCGGNIPRILNWSCNSLPSYKVLLRKIFGESAKKLKLRNISPRSDERERLKLGEYFDKGKGKFVDVGVEDSDDDFVDASLVVKRGLISSGSRLKKSAISLSDVVDELKKVSKKQESLLKEFNDLKANLKNNFENVFDCLKVLMRKVGVASGEAVGAEVEDLGVRNEASKEEKKGNGDDDDDSEESFEFILKQRDGDGRGDGGASAVGGDIGGEVRGSGSDGRKVLGEGEKDDVLLLLELTEAALDPFNSL